MGLKVAFLLNKFPLLSETFVLNQITGLLDRGCSVDIYARGPADEPKQHPDVARYGLEAFDLLQDRLPCERRAAVMREVWATALPRCISSPALLRACLRKTRPGGVHAAAVELYPAAVLLRRGPYDIVHAHYGLNGNWAASLRALGAFQAKIVTTFHDGFDLSTYVSLHGADVYAPAFHHNDLILPISDAVQRRLLELGCPADKTAVHRVGVDLGRYAKPRLRAAGGPVRVTSTARLTQMKGIAYGIDAVSALVRQGLDVEYRIAGDGPLRESLQARIEELGLGPRVRLLGWQDAVEVQQLLAESDLFLAPSVTDSNGSQEGIPTALMEAMAAGLPVVSTNYSGIPELIRDQVDGYLTPERDTAALTARLGELARDSERRRAMGESARRRVAEMHDIARLNDQLLERYRRLLER